MWNWLTQNAAYIFPAVYGIARLVSHMTPSYTVAGKAAAWILGHVPQTPAPTDKP